jgi:hypothetical protein
MPSPDHYDLAVIGGGSAGVAAALAAARMGLRTVVVERDPHCGGTATLGGVNCWEMGVGGTGIPFDIYRRLRRDRPDAVAIASVGRHFMFQKPLCSPREPDRACFPGGERVVNPNRTYLDTLRRHPGADHVKDEAFIREFWNGVVFLREPMIGTLEAMLLETGRVELVTGVVFADVTASADRVDAATLTDGRTIAADAWVDAAGGAFSKAAGCQILRGVDPRARFDEPSAPDAGSDALNAVTLVYRVTPTDRAAIEPLPPDVPDACWWAARFPAMSCVADPAGGRTCNMLPTMEGREWARLGDAAMAECRRRVRAHWHFVQTHWPEFRRFELASIAPRLGVRESGRVLCEKMLTERDILLGVSGQSDPDLVTVVDHALDRHGERGGIREVDEPYGVPYRCLVPRGRRNLLVAGRAAGLSSIAASSCRLTRTMMQLGQAAGTAAALARAASRELPDVNAAELRAELRAQHVQLDWPLPDELREYVSEES